MKYEPKYNRLHILEFYDEDWIIDRSGNLVMREDAYKNYNEAIPTQTVKMKE